MALTITPPGTETLFGGNICEELNGKERHQGSKQSLFNSHNINGIVKVSAMKSLQSKYVLPSHVYCHHIIFYLFIRIYLLLYVSESLILKARIYLEII